LLRAASAHAGGGPFGIDHEWGLDNSGIWAQKDQNVIEYAALATEIGGGIWFGRDSELGHTFWQSVDSTAISSISAEILKLAFSRARPDQGGNPNKWFQGSCCDSFPSGEVTVQASFVTPIIINYAHSDPTPGSRASRIACTGRAMSSPAGPWAAASATGAPAAKFRYPYSCCRAV
jgi:undecaprenyl-diphosphatase